MNGDGTGIRPLTPASTTQQLDPTFSPDGRMVAYAEGRNLWVANVNGGGVRRITAQGANDQSPAFAPDGRRLAFLRGDVGDIFVVNLDGSGLRNLTNDPEGEETDAAWSPDGRRIAYTRAGCAPGSNEGGVCVWVMNADGTGKTLLTPEDVLAECPDSAEGFAHRRHSNQPSWSPDGTRIAYAGYFISCREHGGSDIWVMNSDGSGKRNLIGDSHTNDRQPTWSPDATRIAFVSDRGRDDTLAEIWTVSPEGGGLTRLTSDAALDEDPEWGPLAAPPALCANVVRGSQRGDSLRGTADGDRLVGLGGNDVLNGLGGDDCLEGGPGNDRLTGNAGSDRYSAGAGNDTVNSADSLQETVDCGTGLDTATVDRVDRTRGCERVRRR